MSRIIIADSSPLIALLNIDQFPLLEYLFEQIIILQQVADEITRGESENSIWFNKLQSGYVRIEPLKPDARLAILLLQIDPGESEAILLADQLKLPLLIDDLAGRKMAQDLGITITGLVGVLLALKRKNVLLNKPMLEIVADLEQVNFRISKPLKQLLL
ncbi:DUF3368 domain-containing protein [Thiofilum flexile]|uniref:DUF3368 domain-containing protein n=1 Tax=Thiofilum flexile TaxID=125627 RepID=UPI0003694C02|nr:DUF3368 domain-containing protein [Thiofilum flexile]